MDLVPKHIYLGSVGFRVDPGFQYMLDLREFQPYMCPLPPFDVTKSWG